MTTPVPTPSAGTNVVNLRPTQAAPLAPGGSGPHDPDMEARVRALEDITATIRDDLKSIKQDTTKLTVDLAEVKGRTSQMPTVAQLIALVVAIFGAAFALLKLASH